MSQKYNINRAVNEKKLHRKCKKNFGSNFLGLTHDDINVYAEFTVALDSAEEATFNDLIAQHNEAPDHYLIYQYDGIRHHDHSKTPYDLNYKTGLRARLHPKHDLIKGRLQKTTYYAEAELQSNGDVIHSIPVVEVHFVWHLDPYGFVYKRESTICWYLTNGTLGEGEKDMEKYYTNEESIAEGKRRRGNVVNTLYKNTVGIIKAFYAGSKNDQEVLEEGRVWIAQHKECIDLYIDNYNQKLLGDLAVDPAAWLDHEVAPGVTARMYLIGEVTL